MKRKQSSSGIPRPYSSTELPNPNNTINKLIHPLTLWQFILNILIIITTFLILLHRNSYSYTKEIVLSCVILIFIGLLYKKLTDYEFEDNPEIPSLNDVHMAYKYLKLASTISILTLIMGLLTIFTLFSTHYFDSFYLVDDSTLFTVIILTGISYLSSYSIVRTLCSYSPSYNIRRFRIPLHISTIPQLIAAIGFSLSPLLILYTAFIWSNEPLITLPFTITVIDTISVIFVMELLYLLLVKRL